MSTVGGYDYVEFVGTGTVATAIMFSSVFSTMYGTYFKREFQHTYDAILAAPVDTEELVTGEVLSKLPQLGEIRTGLLHLFLQHTSASISINENADADVPRDLEAVFSAIAPKYTLSPDGLNTGEMNTFLSRCRSSFGDFPSAPTVHNSPAPPRTALNRILDPSGVHVGNAWRPGVAPVEATCTGRPRPSASATRIAVFDAEIRSNGDSEYTSSLR